ncbi:MAG: hypothetical protein GY711_10860 [bacterium]|nr:hypothetical protein [bacterium]
MAILLAAASPAQAQCVVDVSAGADFSVAVHASGRVQAWGGSNGHGQLGNGTFGGSSANPAYVLDESVGTAPVEGAAAATSGFAHNLLLMRHGTVKAFGDNTHGQLGDGFVGVDRPRAVDT